MEKSRQMDKAQNQNARFIDNFGANNKTSVKTTNPPGKHILPNNKAERAHSASVGLSLKFQKTTRRITPRTITMTRR